MSNSKVRKETRFLTDKMAHELSLTTAQYNDVYEINYDFIAGIRYLMDDVLRGEEWTLNRYYDYLDVRNDDLRWVLNSRQYSRFMQAAYFYSPVYMNGGRWSFRIYITYTNSNHFFLPCPYHYRTYSGRHYRTHFNNVSYYRGRYNAPVYNGAFRIRDNKSYQTHRRSDFGSVTIRPNTNRRPEAAKPQAKPQPKPQVKPQPQARPQSPTKDTPRRSEATRRSSNDKKNEVNTPKREENTKKEATKKENTRRSSTTREVKSSSGSSRRSSSGTSSSTSTTRTSSRSTEKTNNTRR